MSPPLLPFRVDTETQRTRALAGRRNNMLPAVGFLLLANLYQLELGLVVRAEDIVRWEGSPPIGAPTQRPVVLPKHNLLREERDKAPARLPR